MIRALPESFGLFSVAKFILLRMVRSGIRAPESRFGHCPNHYGHCPNHFRAIPDSYERLGHPWIPSATDVRSGIRAPESAFGLARIHSGCQIFPGARSADVQAGIRAPEPESGSGIVSAFGVRSGIGARFGQRHD